MTTTIVTNAGTSGVGPNALNIIRVQEKLISVMAERDGFWTPFIGTSMDSVVQRITDLEKNPGDTVRFHIGAKINADQNGVDTSGVDGDNTLEGNEVVMNNYTDTIVIDQKRQAILLDGKMTEQRSAIKLRKEAGPRLGIWTREYLTESLTYVAAGARGVRTGNLILPTAYNGFAGNTLITPDLNHYQAGNQAAGSNSTTLLNTDKMSTAVLDFAKRHVALLMNTGAGIRPVTIKGKKYLMAILTPEQMYDLRQDTKWQTAQQEGNVRGDDNPLFSGAEGFWNGFIIYENSCGVIFNDAVAYAGVLAGNGCAAHTAARCTIIGAQAIGMAYGDVGAGEGSEGRWKYIEKDNFDYYDKVGFAVASIHGFKKIQFNSTDYGCFTVDTAYTA